jgi:hypothetical protein
MLIPSIEASVKSDKPSPRFARCLRHGSPFIDETTCEFDLLASQLGRVAGPNPARFCLSAPRTGAFVYEFAFELGHARENRQHHTACWRCRVGPWLMKGSQASFGLFQQFGELQQITR